MNHDLRCEEFLPILKQEFGSLWNCRPRGDTLEVLTPFSTVTEKFVSVFITSRENTLIVSDGGWIEEQSDFYETAQDSQEVEYRARMNHFCYAFNVSNSTRATGEKIYFKKCENMTLLSSAVYDMSNFINCVVNSSALQVETKAEFENKKTFRSEANGFLSSHFPEVKLNHGIDGLDKIKFSAVLVKPLSLSLVCYVTGSTTYYFASDLRRSIINFELANSSNSAPFIKSRIALMDDNADGYEPNRNTELVSLLGTHKGHSVTWTDRESLIQVLQE